MGFKLPKDLEQIAKEHGLSKGEVENFADKHNITGVTRGGSGGTGKMTADEHLAASYSHTPSDMSFYSDKKRDKAAKKYEKGDAIMSRADEARASGKSRKADRLERRASRKYRKGDKKMTKAQRIENMKKV
mgnify:CR=1 FL=1